MDYDKILKNIVTEGSEKIYRYQDQVDRLTETLSNLHDKKYKAENDMAVRTQAVIVPPIIKAMLSWVANTYDTTRNVVSATGYSCALPSKTLSFGDRGVCGSTQYREGKVYADIYLDLVSSDYRSETFINFNARGDSVQFLMGMAERGEGCRNGRYNPENIVYTDEPVGNRYPTYRAVRSWLEKFDILDQNDNAFYHKQRVKGIKVLGKLESVGGYTNADKVIKSVEVYLQKSKDKPDLREVLEFNEKIRAMTGYLSDRKIITGSECKDNNETGSLSTIFFLKMVTPRG